MLGESVLLSGGEALAVAIRLKRMGRKRRPFYRVIVVDGRKPRQGKAADDLGYYNPMTDPVEIQIDAEKALAWLKDGAKPSDTVKSLLSKAGILQTFRAQAEPTEEDEAQTVEESDGEEEEEP